MQRLLLFLTILLSYPSLSFAHSSIDNEIFIPDFRFQTTPQFNDYVGASLLVEAGRKNVRLNGTLGLLYGEDERIKATCEFLQQKLTYHHNEQNQEKAMQQYAFGISYRQDFCFSYLRGGEVKGYLSYAPSRRLNNQVFFDRVHARHIDGSTAYGGEVNVEVSLWNSCAMTIGLMYDGVTFHRRFQTRKYIAGFGGDIHICQCLSDKFALNINAEFRRPFNYLEANLQWLPLSNLSCCLFGTYTNGKTRLPNIVTAGIAMNYSFSMNKCSQNECTNSLSSWVSKPAVCLPEVLAIAEERICHFPNSSSIPPFVISTTGFYAISVSQFFINPDLLPMTFSAEGLPAGSVINSLTGVISGYNPANGVYPVTVTANKNCGATSQNFTITYL